VGTGEVGGAAGIPGVATAGAPGTAPKPGGGTTVETGGDFAEPPEVAGVGVSQTALIRNCSLSRPRVTGEANSTRSSRGEFSRRGIKVLAAAACPVISTPF